MPNVITVLEACKTVIERLGKKDPAAKYCLEQINKLLTSLQEGK